VFFAALVAYPAAASTRLPLVVLAIGIAASVVFVFSLLSGWSFGIAWAVFGFGAEYALFLRLRGASVDTRSIFIAGALVLVAELAFRCVLPVEGAPDRVVALRSFLMLVGSVLGAMIVAGIVLVAAGSVRSSLVFEALGVGAAALTLAAVVRVAARARGAPTR
jgi:hypothetical protein